MHRGFPLAFCSSQEQRCQAYSHFGNKAMPCANICSACRKFRSAHAIFCKHCGKMRKHRGIHSNGTHVFTYIYKKSRGLRFGIFAVGPQGFEPWLTEPKPVVTTITPWTKLRAYVSVRRCKITKIFYSDKFSSYFFLYSLKLLLLFLQYHCAGW